ncbi:MAG: hypothetical protein Q9227_001544 [Pyrenula ochraceoflavens]
MSTIATVVNTVEQQKPRTEINGYKDFVTVKIDTETELRGSEKSAPASFPEYLPVWDNEKGQKLAPLQPFDHYDHGKDADPALPEILGKAEINDLTGTIGAEVKGLQLSQLSDAGKDQLALFVAQKNVVAFRDQDFASLPIPDALQIGSYFGRLHVHPASGAPKDYPEVHLVHRGAEDTTVKDFFESRTSSVTWHSDVTYEAQPPGTTFLYTLDNPKAGGDTLFLNMVAAYKRLSPEFAKRLEGLKAVHSGYEQATSTLERGGVIRRDPVKHEHPIIRTHPVTGEKALFVNPQFTRYIVGFKKEESDMLLKFLYDHMAYSQDLQCRVKWEKGTVVVWDVRCSTFAS